MNLWLSEHLDLDLLARSDDSNVNVLVHGNSLTKYRGRPRLARSPFHWLTEAELEAYRVEKSAWDKTARHELTAAFQAACTKRGFPGSFAPALERLFYHSSFGCLDALAFVASIQRHGSASEVMRAICGDRYRLKELITLVWWIALCNVRMKSGGCEFVWTSRDNAAEAQTQTSNILAALAEKHRAVSRLDGEFPRKYRAGNAPVFLAWVGALKYPAGWDEEMRRRGAGDAAVIRIAEEGRGLEFPTPCLELSAGAGFDAPQLGALFECASRAVSNIRFSGVDEPFDWNGFRDAITYYYRESVAPLVVQRLHEIVDAIDARFCGVSIRGAFSVTAPFLETIALHAWLARQNIKPVLLPHSWTSSHEFPPDTYDRTLALVSSRFLMPSAFDAPGTLDKEEVIDLAAIRRRHEEAYQDRRAAMRNIVLLKSMPISQSWRLVRSRFEEFRRVRQETRRFHNLRNGRARRIGLLLNYEHYEFSAGLDFERFFARIGQIVDVVTQANGKDDTTLVIRRKPGWTNLHLLRDAIERNRKCKPQYIIAPDAIGLMEFGAACEVVLFIQGTSAIPELMSSGIPVARLVGPAVPILLEDQYIEISPDVVPALSIEEVLSRFDTDARGFAELGMLQKDWINKQMKPTAGVHGGAL